MNPRVPPPVDWSCRLYARLLALLPGSLRQAYDQPIRQAFRDLSLAAWQAHGALGLVAVWLQALPDLADGAAREWQTSLILGGAMERVSVRTSLLMALVICAALLAFLVLPRDLNHVVALLTLMLALAGILSVAFSGWRSRHWQPAAADNFGSQPAAAYASPARPSRARLLLIGLELAVLGLLVYVVRYLFLVPPQLSPAVAHRFMIDPNQIGTDRLVGTFILAAYLVVTWIGARGAGPGARPWRVGLACGGLAGLAAVVLTLAGRRDIALLVMCAAAGLAGAMVGRRTAQTEAGALGGFWCGLAGALVWTAGGIVLDLALAAPPAAGALASAHVFCQDLVGVPLAACAVSADYRTWGLVLLAVPVLSGGLGAIGGFWGPALSKARAPVASDWGRALVAPVVFCGAMLLIAIAGIAHLL